MPPRFPAQTIEAVGACTRALDGPGNAEAMLARADAATLGGLRAYGDRLALRQRWHDARVERQHRPRESPATEIFDALELARLDGIGARSLAGVAHNLLAHPGADRDGLRWLAFEAFAGRPAPALKSEMVAAVRASLPPALARSLEALARDLHDHARFAGAAASWSREAGRHITSAVSAGDARSFPWLNTSVEYVLRPQQLDADAAGTPVADQNAARKTSPGGDSTYAAEELARGRAGGNQAYKIFTTAHDRVVDAARLAMNGPSRDASSRPSSRSKRQ